MPIQSWPSRRTDVQSPHPLLLPTGGQLSAHGLQGPIQKSETKTRGTVSRRPERERGVWAAGAVTIDPFEPPPNSCCLSRANGEQKERPASQRSGARVAQNSRNRHRAAAGRPGFSMKTQYSSTIRHWHLRPRSPNPRTHAIPRFAFHRIMTLALNLAPERQRRSCRTVSRLPMRKRSPKASKSI
jgi:hypothetical protein